MIALLVQETAFPGYSRRDLARLLGGSLFECLWYHPLLCVWRTRSRASRSATRRPRRCPRLPADGKAPRVIERRNFWGRAEFCLRRLACGRDLGYGRGPGARAPRTPND